MFVQVLHAREALALVALAVSVRALQRVARAAVFAVDLALVPQEPAGVRKPGELLALRCRALVRPVVLVHVFAVWGELVSAGLWEVGWGGLGWRDVMGWKEGFVTYPHSHFRGKVLTRSVQPGKVQ